MVIFHSHVAVYVSTFSLCDCPVKIVMFHSDVSLLNGNLAVPTLVLNELNRISPLMTRLIALTY